MKLRFSENAYVNRELFAKKGDVKEISNEFGSADRWLKRGAVHVTDEIIEKEVEEEIIEDIVDDSVIDLEKMNKEELLKFAALEGIVFPKEVKNKADIKDFVYGSLKDESEEVLEDVDAVEEDLDIDDVL